MLSDSFNKDHIEVKYSPKSRTMLSAEAFISGLFGHFNDPGLMNENSFRALIPVNDGELSLAIETLKSGGNRDNNLPTIETL